MIDYKKKWTLITGASSGIGECFARKLAGRGSNLILVARRQPELITLAEELNRQFNIEAYVIPLDLAETTAPQTLFAEVNKLNIEIDILINNAGIGVSGLLHKTDIHKNEQLLLLNVYSLSILTQLFLPQMVQRKSGIIINIASCAAFQPVPYMSNYGASKAFVLSFTESLWAEYKDLGIRILACCPGAVRTEFSKAMRGRDSFLQKDEPGIIVDDTLKALEKNRRYVVPGSIKTFLLALLARLFPRKLTLSITKMVMEPKN